MITVHRREGAGGFVAGNFGAGQFRGLIKLDTDCFVAVPRSREETGSWRVLRNYTGCFVTRN